MFEYPIYPPALPPKINQNIVKEKIELNKPSRRLELCDFIIEVLDSGIKENLSVQQIRELFIKEKDKLVRNCSSCRYGDISYYDYNCNGCDTNDYGTSNYTKWQEKVRK